MHALDMGTLCVTSPKILKQSVRRNDSRLPESFMFESTKMELERLSSQFVNL